MNKAILITNPVGPCSPVNGRRPGQLPYFRANLHVTKQDVPYFSSPGVALISKPHFDPSALLPFLQSFATAGADEEILSFSSYAQDTGFLTPAEHLCKAAGQICYLSFGGKRTKNEQAAGYFGHIKESGHGSVLEHANYSFVLWGISRSLTHELVRHRAGWAYSQVSQRYVSGHLLRFVMRPEFQEDSKCQTWAEDSFNVHKAMYETLADALLQPETPLQLEGLPPTDRRKAVNQVARTILPNCTETAMIATANVRALRHFLSMRGSLAAEPEIRSLAFRILAILQDKEVAPMLFSDFNVYRDVDSGRPFIHTDYPKV